MFDFQPKGKTWKERATLCDMRAVLDPEGSTAKNQFINMLHERALSKILAKGKKTASVLDFGCGIGRLHNFLKKYFTKYVGIDVTPEMVSRANSLYTDDFLSFDGQNIPLDGQSVDVVCSVLVLQHINNPVELKFLIGEFKRVLKTGGRVIFIEQVTSEKTKDFYCKFFIDNGFKEEIIKSVRYGASLVSWLVGIRSLDYFLQNRIIADILYYINEMEIAMPSIKKNTYQETVFVFVKE